MVEREARFTGASSAGDLGPALTALREHVGELQLPQIAHGRRAIILFEGLQGSAKKVALRQLAMTFDPCHFVVPATAAAIRRRWIDAGRARAIGSPVSGASCRAPATRPSSSVAGTAACLTT